MRCSVCGTENTPDSRFCGGCGARVAVPSARVAPTAKISDDAAYPPTGHLPTNAPGPASIPPGAPVGPPSMPGGYGGYQAGPPSIAPQNHGTFASQPPASIPPQNNFYTPPPGSIPPSNGVPAPGSIPPQNASSGPYRPASSPPFSPPSVRAPHVSARSSGSPSLSVPPPRRWGLVITILLFDLALAGAGVYLLTEGLS